MLNFIIITPQRKSYLIRRTSSCLLVGRATDTATLVLRSPIRTFVAQDAPVSRLTVADNRNSWAVLNRKKSRLFLQFNIESSGVIPPTLCAGSHERGERGQGGLSSRQDFKLQSLLFESLPCGVTEHLYLHFIILLDICYSFV